MIQGCLLHYQLHNYTLHKVMCFLQWNQYKYYMFPFTWIKTEVLAWEKLFIGFQIQFPTLHLEAKTSFMLNDRHATSKLHLYPAAFPPLWFISVVSTNLEPIILYPAVPAAHETSNTSRMASGLLLRPCGSSSLPCLHAVLLRLYCWQFQSHTAQSWFSYICKALWLLFLLTFTASFLAYPELPQELSASSNVLCLQRIPPHP